MLFAFFCEICTECLEKRKKNTVFSDFLRIVVQKAQNSCFSHLCELCTKSLERRENTLFSHTYRGTSCKSSKNAVFCISCSKKLFFASYAQKTLFFAYYANKKQCFFAFFAKSMCSVSENVKNTVFTHFFSEGRAISSNNAVSCILCGLLTKCLEKRDKAHFLTLFADHRAKCSKNAVCSFIANFVQRVSKNVTKHCFLTILRNFVQKALKTMFFCEICTKSLDKREKLCFLTLFADRRVKSSKNAVFFVFCELCIECLEKRLKTMFSHT